ncbi:hypothetical protein [Arthrobacter sp. BE255]|uniref:hypothetical protein n=1 Tax=Arthrobacter sp. BE255 TaxID=2817721 RepID=UPI00285630EA|nr:hypothetical protein [Arthrobacter sp. BE255]MDR7161396.1 hypothetical protein [Arthrobacter sp. BE255]
MRERRKILVILIGLCLAALLAVLINPFGWTALLTGHLSGQSANTPSEDVVAPVDFDPLTAEVPSLCGQPSGRLAGGELLNPDGGGTYVRKDSAGDVLAAVDERPDDAEAVSVLALTCSKGGVGWPDTIAVYGRASQLLGHVTLDSITNGSRERVQAVEISDGRPHASWTAEGEGDPACCGTVAASTSFELVDSVLKPGSVSLENEETALNAFLDALNREDEATAETYIKADEVRKLSALRAAEGPLHPVQCYGLLNSTEIPDHLLDSLRLDALGNINLPSNSGIRRFCTVSNGANREFIFGWGYKDAGGWLIRFIST